VLRQRLITAAIAIPLLIWIVFWAPLWILIGVVFAATFIALREFAAMACDGVPHGTTMITVGGMTIAVAMGLSPGGIWISAALVACLAGVLISTLATARELHEMQRTVDMAGRILLGCLYGGLLLPHFIWVRNLPQSGSAWVCFVIACVMAGDAGGYFGGRWFGQRKLWPAVSPKKTVEGAMAAFACTLVMGTVVDALVLNAMGPFEVIAVSGVVSVLAQLGDLLESMLKRAYDAKDSGWIFPGHGGVLDRTDSLVLPIVFVYYYAILGHGYVARF
jgi:phosphatidate cytidylyltransferase